MGDRMKETLGKYIKNRKLPWQILLGIQSVICSVALQENSLVELEWGYYVDIPVIKWFFAIFQKMDGRGMEVVFLMSGLACMFYLLKDSPEQKNFWIRGISVFFGICMVFGRSYYDLKNWNYIFHGRLQFGLACFVFLGYYWMFKNIIILLAKMCNNSIFNRNVSRGKVEKWLFEKHPFLGPLLVIVIGCLPIMICFFPGTLQWDAHGQLWTYIGRISWTGHHPVAITWFLGQCLHISRTVFGNDSMTLFLYAGPQYIIQWLVFAYGCYIIGRLKAPFLLRWGALVYFAFFPLLQIYGFTVVKDSYYYIFCLLFVVIIIHIFVSKRICWWQYVLIAISSVAVNLTRNNGLYVLILFLISLPLLYKRYWKVCVLAFLCLILSRYVVEDVYMVQKDIKPGPVGEALSIPLQQTARYVKEHYEEITEEELDVLSRMFNVEVVQLAELYTPEISDPVKGQFIAHPSNEELKMYFEVWFAQLCKHPDTYIQAWLNHIYGYFYPNRYQSSPEGIGYYRIGNQQHWQDGSLDMEFAMEYKELRDMYEKGADVIRRLPLVGMLYSCGFHNYILIGCITFLLAHKKYKEIIILMLSILSVLVCLVSPVNAYIRYMLPVVAALPVTLSWCFYAVFIKSDLEAGVSEIDISGYELTENKMISMK